MKFLTLALLFLCIIAQAKSPETRIKVAVIDTGINPSKELKPFLCTGNHYDVTHTGIEDRIGHGTTVVRLIAERINPKKTCILVLKYYKEDDGNLNRELEALKIILTEPNIKFVNFSSGGDNPDRREQELIKGLIDKQIYFVTAAGNSGLELKKNPCYYYPACYGYEFNSMFFKVVGNGSKPTERYRSSNYGPVVTDWRDGATDKGSGTSFSTAIKTGELAK